MDTKNKLLACLLLLIGAFASAQVATPFTERFSRSLEGGVTIIANNMVSRTATGNYNGEDNNNDQPSVYVDIDADPTTFNSSSANFSNPEVTEPCVSILRAFLYWAAADNPQGGIFGGEDNQPGWDFNEVKLILPGEVNYTTITADEIIYRDRDDPTNSFSNQPYVCVKDISDNVAVLGEDIYGNYQVANVEATSGQLGSTGTAAGWQIVFIYESPELPAKNITLFDGYAHIESDGNAQNIDVDFNGFVTVPSGPVGGDIVMGSLEGDRRLFGDRLQIQQVAAAGGAFVDLVAPERDADNFFNSRITVGNGDFLDRVPASRNTLGFDAAVFELDNPNNTILDNNTTATTIRITSNQETYGLYLLGLAVEVYKPNLDPMLITPTCTRPITLPGDTVCYNFNLQNRGNDDTLNLTLTSQLPPQITYVTPNPGDLPAGVVPIYDEPNNELRFNIADGLMDEGDPALGIDMEFLIKDDCFFLEENCDLDFEIEFEASFNGALNPNDPLISISTVDPDTCLDNPVIIEIQQPTINWATAPLDLDRTLSCEDAAGLDAAQLLAPETDICNPFQQLTLNKISGTFEQDPDCPSAGTYTNLWNFTDACGVTIANYEQTITIQDLVPPTATDPEAVSVQCIDNVPAQDPEVVIDEADNCSTPIVAFVSEEIDGTTCPITITRIYSVTDACGNTANVSHVINVNDDIAPTASNPQTISVQCLDDVPNQDINVVTDEADNCSTPVVEFVSESIDGATCPIIVTRIYSVTDACNNTINVTQVINVTDDVAPTASNLVAVNVSCIGDIPAANVELITDEADNCSVPTVAFVSDVSDGQTCPETITRTYSVTDACNNSIEVTQIITVNDDIAPTADSLSPITGIQCIAEVPQPDISLVRNAADNCSTPTVSFVSDTSDNSTCPETIMRLYRVTDACDNSIDVVQTIIINDDRAPQLVSPLEPNITISCGEIPEVPVLEFTDNCSSNVTVDFEETTVPVDPMTYTLIRRWTVSDDCDNEDVFTQEISVEVTSVLDSQTSVLCIEDSAIDLNDFLSNTNVTSETWTASDPTILNGSIFDPNVPIGTYEFNYSYTNDSNCVFRTSVSIEINEDCVQCVKTLADDISISKLVTPNNDGLNDVLIVEYDIKNTNARLCAFSISLDIYNRWGTKVYSNANYDNTWRGESPGASLGASENLPTGTYYYIVKFNDTAEEIDPIQGYILLGSN